MTPTNTIPSWRYRTANLATAMPTAALEIPYETCDSNPTDMHMLGEPAVLVMTTHFLSDPARRSGTNALRVWMGAIALVLN